MISVPVAAPSTTATEAKGKKGKGKKNKKIGKAEKKRIQQEKLRGAETEFDNEEDALLLQVRERCWRERKRERKRGKKRKR